MKERKEQTGKKSLEDMMAYVDENGNISATPPDPVSYTHLRAHETVLDLVCRLLLEKNKNNKAQQVS